MGVAPCLARLALPRLGIFPCILILAQISKKCKGFLENVQKSVKNINKMLDNTLTLCNNRGHIRLYDLRS